MGGWVVGESYGGSILVEWLFGRVLHPPAHASITHPPTTHSPGGPIPFHIHCSTLPFLPPTPSRHDILHHLLHHNLSLLSLSLSLSLLYFRITAHTTTSFPPLPTMSSPPREKPPRKFPAPCWTQDETLALIDAYRDRWYALRRGYLRTADWDAVVAAVTSRCPDASPAKTSAQCRHKMEKLRQRYRAEKQRSLSFPGRFFSSWFFFENMDSMAVGTDGSNPNPNFGSKKIEAKSNHNFGADEEGVDLGGGLGVKVSGGQRSVTLGLRARNSSPHYGSRVLNGYSPYLEDGSDEDIGDDTDFGEGFGARTPIDVKLVPPVFRAKKVEKIPRNFGPNFDSSHDGGGYVHDGGGFRVKNPKFDASDDSVYVKISGDRFSVPKGYRSKSSGKNDGNSCSNPDPRSLNGYSSTVALGVGKKSAGRGGKRERDPIADMVSSIKLLGEGFVKMEKMKMEMAREIEKMRIEMDMKRNELILESQRQIVDAFVTVLMEEKKKKRESTPVLPES